MDGMRGFCATKTMLHEQVLKMCRDISAEHDPAKLIVLIKQLRKVLAEEQQRIAALIAKNDPKAARPEELPS